MSWLVAACGVLGLVVGLCSLLIAEDWGDRVLAAFTIAVAIAGIVSVRRVFVRSRSR